MTAAELKKSPIAIPEFGPLKVEPEDWHMLVRHTKAFCGKNPYFDGAALDMCFIIVSEGQRNRMLLLPVSNRESNDISGLVKSFSKTIAAFGYVKGVSSMEEYHAETDPEVKKSITTLEPVNYDVKQSVELDKIVGRPIYYIIMNRKFEYEIYKTPIENLFGILQPVEEKPPVEEAQPSAEARDDAFECRNCGLRFKSIGEAKRHTEANSGHKIFRLERTG